MKSETTAPSENTLTGLDIQLHKALDRLFEDFDKLQQALIPVLVPLPESDPDAIVPLGLDLSASPLANNLRNHITNCQNLHRLLIDLVDHIKV